MAEAACVLHAFTFPSYEPKQGVEVDGLQESVSFGRFATETLAWDKWSSFSNKRYVEEAAKHSQPGLVAKKKAFFEAYYKKKAKLEQENAEDGNYNQELDAEDENLNVQYLSLETVAADTPAMVSEQDGAETLDADLELNSEHLDVANKEAVKMELITCTKENEAISRDVKASLEVSELSAGKMLPFCLQRPVVPRVSSKRAHSAKGHRVSFKQSTEDIISNTDELPTSKNPQEGLILEATAIELTEAKRSKTLLNSPASKSRRNKTDMRLSSESSKARTESDSPIISSPIGFGTGKGTEKNREKLEEILNSKASKRVKLQTKIKEKAASQLKKLLRLGFCFCSKQSPDLHHQNQAVKNQAKNVFQQEKHRSFMTNGCWKHVEKHRCQRQIRPGSLGEAIAQKGKSTIAQIL